MAEPDPPTRCPWCGTDPCYVAYHGEEWGVPLRDERRLFELLIGPTIFYGMMQSAGLVDDHLTCCFRHGAAAAQAIDKTASG